MALSGQIVCGTVIRTCDGANCIPTTVTAFRTDAEGITVSGTIGVATAGEYCQGAVYGIVTMSAGTYTEIVDALQETGGMENVVFAIVCVCFAIGLAVGFSWMKPPRGGLE